MAKLDFTIEPCTVPLPPGPPVQPKLSKRAARAPSFDPAVAAVFGQILRAERVRQGFAQDQFALAAGLDRSYFGKLERGERQPSLVLLLRIAAGLDISLTDLVRRFETELTRSRSILTTGGADF